MKNKPTNFSKLIRVKRREFNPAFGFKGEFVEDEISMTIGQFNNVTGAQSYIDSQKDNSTACPLTLTIIEDKDDIKDIIKKTKE